LPVDVAREVGTYRIVILSIARSLWLKNHPGRYKVPNGFADAFDLRLISIQPGSAQPAMILERPDAIVDDLWIELENTFSNSRDLLTDTLVEIASGQPAPAHFPPSSLNELRKLGASLAEGETLTVGPPQAHARRATIDRQLRESIGEIASTFGDSSQLVDLTGLIVQFNGEQSSFGLRTDRSVSTCSFRQNPALAKKAKDYLATDGVTAPEVRITGRTRDGDSATVHLFAVESIEVVHSIGEHAILQRIRGFAKIRAGEMGPDSRPPTREIRRQAETLAPEIHAIGMPVAIVPTAAGGISLEWSRGEHSLSIDLDPGGRMFLCSDNTLTDELMEFSGIFNLQQAKLFLVASELP
jgi:hypothetical protein